MSQATDNINFDQLAQTVLTANGVIPSYAIGYAIDQNRLESNNYTSHVFLAANNFNGYKYPPGGSSDPLTDSGIVSPEGDNYAAFATLEDCLQTQSNWWGRRSAAGFDLTTLTSITAWANALAQFQWYTSSPTAYAARMTAVSALVSLQASTGTNTQGVDLTTISLGTALVIGLGIYLIVK